MSDPHPPLASGTSRPDPESATAAGGFDFLMGEWRVHHRKLKQRLAGDNEWWDFEGESSCRKILGGLGNLDDNVLEQPDASYRALTLRLFSSKTALWSIWWISDRTSRIEPPVHGRFENGLGSFFGDDSFEGRPIRVRFIWSAITARSARWEQAFSADGGAGWETNWLMNFERAA